VEEGVGTSDKGGGVGASEDGTLKDGTIEGSSRG
jgi:hypothetical protein